MPVLEATVLSPMHLELATPLSLRKGTRVAITVSEETTVSEEATVSEETDAATSSPKGHRQREQAWRLANKEVLNGYADQWVVLEGEEIIAHGTEPTELVQVARDRGIQSPYIFFVEPTPSGVVKIGL